MNRPRLLWLRPYWVLARVLPPMMARTIVQVNGQLLSGMVTAVRQGLVEVKRCPDCGSTNPWRLGERCGQKFLRDEPIHRWHSGSIDAS